MGASHLGKALEGACAVAAAVCMAVGLAPSASADDTTADAARLPDHIVNGDFSYDGGLRKIVTTQSWTAVVPSTGENFSYSQGGWRSGPTGWDESRFGWRSTQTDGDDPRGEQKAGAVEIQWRNFAHLNNIWAEIVAAQVGTAIYQDIRVTPGNTYHWSLKHQSVSGANTMQVLIGEPGKEQPQQAKRTKTNGGSDQLGAVGTEITTNNKLSYRDDAKGATENWETYEGDWTCPEGVTVARFTFKTIKGGSWPTNGNLVDDIGFSQSTVLHYDPNGGTGTIADQTVGVGVNAYTATDGYTFAGHGLASWNTKPDGTGDSYKPGGAIIINKPTTLYAQWADTTQTAMPETGGTLTNRNLTTILGGGLPSGPHANPVGKTAQAPIETSGKAV